MKKSCHFMTFCLIFFSASVIYAETRSIEDITASNYYIWEVDAAADSDGNIHIAMNRLDWLRYATNASGTWSVSGDITVVDESVSIALDSAGNAYIAYYEKETMDLTGHTRLYYAAIF